MGCTSLRVRVRTCVARWARFRASRGQAGTCSSRDSGWVGVDPRSSHRSRAAGVPEGGWAVGGGRAMVDRMERNEGIVSRFLNAPEFQELLSRELARRIYWELRPSM